MAKQLVSRPAAVPTAVEVATLVMDAVHLVLRLVRTEARRQQASSLSLSQLRALDYLSANPDRSLSAVAEYIGLALPSASALIDGLARRALVTRLAASGDRRRLRLSLTAAGQGGPRPAPDPGPGGPPP